MKDKDVIILWAVLDNEVIGQLKTVDDYDRLITPVIQSLARTLEESGVEIYHYGNTYLVTEEEIYIGVYEDEWDEENGTTNIPVYDGK
jgi:hypothetical protein